MSAFDEKYNPPDYESQDADDFSEDLEAFSSFKNDGDIMGAVGANQSYGFDQQGFGANQGFGAPTQGFGAPMQQPYGGNGAPLTRDAAKEEMKRHAIQAGTKSAVATGKGLRYFFTSFGKATWSTWSATGAMMAYVGVGAVGVAAIVGLLSLVLPVHGAYSVLMGGLFSTFSGIVIMAVTYSKAREERSNAKDVPEQTPLLPAVEDGLGADWGSPQDEDITWDDSDTDDSEDDFTWDSSDDEDDDFSWDDIDTDDSLSWDDSTSSSGTVEVMSGEDAMASLPDITPGTQTRQFLLEQYLKVLPSNNPEYYTWIEHDHDTEFFRNMDDMLNNAARANINNAEASDMPVIISLKENDYVITILCEKRNSRIKPEQVMQEMVNIYAYEKTGGQSGANTNIYGRVISMGVRFEIRIFKGDSTKMVTIGDVVRRNKDFFCNTDYPMIYGVSETGSTYMDELIKLYSLSINGMPRSGKSTFSNALITLTSMFHSPREAVFYITDNKTDTSDYITMCLPHIKYLTQSIEDTLNLLDWIVNVEAKRRSKIIGAAHKSNYNDFIKSNPLAIGEQDMPRLFLVMDELMGLSSNLMENDLEGYKTYKATLSTIVSQFPNLGMYFIGIPHRVVDSVIPKNAYELIPCKVSFMGSDVVNKNVVGATPSNFPYKTSRVGDIAMAVNGIAGGSPTYARGVGLSPDPESARNVYEFIRDIWHRLDPEFYHGPFIDKLDQEEGRFDDYSCGHGPRGGMKASHKMKKLVGRDAFSDLMAE